MNISKHQRDNVNPVIKAYIESKHTPEKLTTWRDVDVFEDFKRYAPKRHQGISKTQFTRGLKSFGIERKSRRFDGVVMKAYIYTGIEQCRACVSCSACDNTGYVRINNN